MPDDYGELCRRINDIHDNIVKIFLKFWWDQDLAMLKADSVETNTLWKAVQRTVSLVK